MNKLTLNEPAISHKKDGRQRQPHRFYVSWPPYPATGSDAGDRDIYVKKKRFELPESYISGGTCRAPTPKKLTKTYYLTRFLQKTAWKWKKMDREGGASLAPPWIPQCTWMYCRFSVIHRGVRPGQVRSGKNLLLSNLTVLLSLLSKS